MTPSENPGFRRYWGAKAELRGLQRLISCAAWNGYPQPRSSHISVLEDRDLEPESTAEHACHASNSKRGWGRGQHCTSIAHVVCESGEEVYSPSDIV